MSCKAFRARDLFEKLRPWLDDDRCRTCDCLQGALTQIELDDETDTKELVSPHKVTREQMHPCLGCNPCPPAEAWAEYIRSLETTPK